MLPIFAKFPFFVSVIDAAPETTDFPIRAMHFPIVRWRTVKLGSERSGGYCGAKGQLPKSKCKLLPGRNRFECPHCVGESIINDRRLPCFELILVRIQFKPHFADQCSERRTHAWYGADLSSIEHPPQRVLERNREQGPNQALDVGP